MDNLSPESIHAQILLKKEEIVKAAVEGIIAQVKAETYYGISQEISKETANIVKAEMLEEIKAAVIAAKPQILEGVTEAISKVVAEIGASMVKKVAANMDGYKGSQVLKNLFD